MIYGRRKGGNTVDYHSFGQAVFFVLLDGSDLQCRLIKKGLVQIYRRLTCISVSRLLFRETDGAHGTRLDWSMSALYLI